MILCISGCLHIMSSRSVKGRALKEGRWNVFPPWHPLFPVDTLCRGCRSKYLAPHQLCRVCGAFWDVSTFHWPTSHISYGIPWKFSEAISFPIHWISGSCRRLVHLACTHIKDLNSAKLSFSFCLDIILIKYLGYQVSKMSERVSNLCAQILKWHWMIKLGAWVFSPLLTFLERFGFLQILI